MAKLKENTVLLRPEDGASVSLLAGEEVPSWAVDQVGDHLIEGAGDGDGDEPKKAGRSASR